MLKLSLRSESCKHSCMLWGASAINPGKANRFGFDPWGDLFFFFFWGSYSPCIPNISFCILFSTPLFFYHLVSNLLISAFYLTVCLFSPLPLPVFVASANALCGWGADVFTSRGRALLANGHVMWSNAQPVALERALGSRAEQARQTLRKRRSGELSLARRGSPAPWAKLESRKGRTRRQRDGEGQKRWQSWCCWQTNIKNKKKMNKKREREKLYTMDCGKPDGLCTKAHFGLQNYIWHSGAYVLGVIHTDTVCCCGFSGMLHAP